MKTLGQRIEARLAELGIRQVELSRRTGISPAVISRAINNPDRELKAPTLFAIADALQVDAEWLFRGRASHSVAESAPAPTQRRPLPRLKRSKFYPRTFFN
ncbi:helix-turn-helix domain-containing protein [Aeromonas caviae]